MARKMPTARVGNYAAPVDTAGMDSEMKDTMGMGAKKAAPKKEGMVSAIRRVLTGSKKGQKGK